MAKAPTSENRYTAIARKIFLDRYRGGAKDVAFEREDIEKTATKLKIDLPKNLGDLIYAIRYRMAMPEEIVATQPKGMEWVIEGTGRACYSFKLVRINHIVPNGELVTVKIPDATPEIISAYALDDEQALLAKVRYNRLVDIFLGITSYSLQNHLRTAAKGIGQIEIDEIYVGVDSRGRQYIIPVQGKGGQVDRLSVVQTKQDILYCQSKFPQLVCRALSAQFMPDEVIAMFELIVDDGQAKIVEERHYCLVPSMDIDIQDLKTYGRGR
jgi:hypothetical protein